MVGGSEMYLASQWRKQTLQVSADWPFEKERVEGPTNSHFAKRKRT